MVLRTLMDCNDDLDDDNTATHSVTACHPRHHAPLSYDRSPLACHSRYDCAPGLLLSDSEESSFASCGTEDFFDFEEITHTLNLIENWQKLHRKVRFGSVRVQEYAITVGDHPICKDGLALSLDWAHSEEKVYDINRYKTPRRINNQRRGIRRKRRVSKLDYWQRREILIRVGSFSYADLSRIECKRNREAVTEFLQDLGTEDYGPSLEIEQESQGTELEQINEGIELEQVYSMDNHGPLSSSSNDGGFGWQMSVQILEG
eukprot:CAMPEP_0197174518 /NCGR_PEP_ID=MMETSP1423-20130617/1006_1 /TAXON_ID=476441 /ORGANISM="Pseudo-nitzschia heimii, Strain UNC1101" /LENGTH=259 /DNA_ID=CAMNT_0042623459 /DNA_START=104 /DNA_END=883 /DNA_ORIENTATION=+